MTERGLLWLLDESKSLPKDVNFEGYGKLLLYCANGDGEISAAERAWVLGFLDAHGAPAAVIDTLAEYDGKGDLARLVEGMGRAVLYDAVRACFADGDLAYPERKAIEKTARAMGLEITLVAELIDLYRQDRELRFKRLRRLDPDGDPVAG